MAAKAILHMLSTLKHMSPSTKHGGRRRYDVTIPYTNVTIDEVSALVQDAMFSRAPSAALRTAYFSPAATPCSPRYDGDRQEGAAQALRSVAVRRPLRSFTTAGAMVACVEKLLREKRQRELKGARIVIYGATGVVAIPLA